MEMSALADFECEWHLRTLIDLWPEILIHQLIESLSYLSDSHVVLVSLGLSAACTSACEPPLVQPREQLPARWPIQYP